jgi:hypothetical protein
MKDTLANELADIEVADTAGSPLLLGSLWRDRTRVLALVRHFG